MNKLNKSIALKAVLPVLGLAFLLALSVGPAFAFADKDDRMMTDKDRDNVVAPTTVAPATYPYSYGYSYGASYPYSYGTSYSYPYSYGYSYPYSYGYSII